MTTTSPYFDVRTVNDVHVIEFARNDVTDPAYIERLGDAIYHYLNPIDNPRVVIDFKNVRYLSSTTLGMLVALHKVMKKQQGRLCMANVADDLYRAFKLTKLHKVFKAYDNTDDAVKSLQ